MELVNELSKAPDDPAARFAAETAVSLIQPYAPHVAEELWSRLGHERLWEEPWPVADESLLQRDTIELVLQVNGKVRDRVQVAGGAARGGAGRARARVREGAGAPERRRAARVDRRSGQARQHRGLTDVLHITNGDSVVSPLLQTGLGGEAFAWRDAYHVGPVRSGERSRLIDARAAFLSSCGWGDEDAIREELLTRDARFVAALRDGREIVLWFEHDLYDQLQLLDVLALAGEAGSIPSSSSCSRSARSPAGRAFAAWAS